MSTCCKTVVILSDDFIQELWPRVSHIVSFALGRPELLGGLIRDDVIVIVCDPLCAIPPELFHFARVYLDDSGHCWRRFLDLLIAASGMYKSALFFPVFSANLHVALITYVHDARTWYVSLYICLSITLEDCIYRHHLFAKSNKKTVKS